MLSFKLQSENGYSLGCVGVGVWRSACGCVGVGVWRGACGCVGVGVGLAASGGWCRL